ncbi:MAG: hypothetical protein NT075_14040 [Chloroflexi bacterium]|nr:hypothetical protein [Chloroflexota bacterium]
MPFFISMILAALIFGSLSMSWKERWLAWKSAKASPANDQNPTAEPTSLPGRVTHKFATLRSKLPFGAKQPPLAQRFGVWANTVLPMDDPLLSWLNSLDPEASTAFTQQVAEFCTEMGFELAALIDGPLEQVPSAAQQAKQIVLHYCYANQEAAFAGTDFAASKRFLVYLRAPFSKTNRVFGQKLYRKLVDKEVVPAPSFELLLASEEKRRAQSLEAIRKAAVENPTAFNLALTEATIESELTERKPKLRGLIKRPAPVVTLAKPEPPPAESVHEHDQPADASVILSA